jgi:hypothetical protein
MYIYDYKEMHAGGYQDFIHNKINLLILKVTKKAKKRDLKC